MTFKVRFIFWLTIAGLFSCTKLQAQQLDSIGVSLHRYGTYNAESSLFVHFDKNIYSNNDQVWFTGYLLKQLTPISDYHTLYVSLVNNTDSTVVLQRKFLIDGGFSFGNMILPDSLPGGSYRFVVNTNIMVNGSVNGEFIQPIHIKSNTKNLLSPSISILEAKESKTGNGTAVLKVLTSDHRFVENADISYTIGRGEIIRRGTAKSNSIGEVRIDFPSALLNAGNNLLTIRVKKEHQLKYIKHELPVDKQIGYKVHFYPEGGYLVEGLINRVGFEVIDFAQKAVEMKAVLYEADKPIDTLLINDWGIGSFMLIPDANRRYTLRLLTKDKLEGLFVLPESLQEGVVINARDVIADDDLRIKLQSTSDKEIHLVVHNYSDIFLHSELHLKKGAAQQVRLNLDAVPPGLHSITILDANFRPVSERVFFAHHDRLNDLKLSTDKEEYTTRDSVKLDLQAILKGNVSYTGLVSISCTQACRFALENNLNIVDYTLLDQELTPLATYSLGMKISNKNYLNDMLLVKGWRRFKWPRPNDDGTNRHISVTSAEMMGQVLKGKRAPASPVELTTINGGNIHVMSSDSTGRFYIPFSNLLVPDEKTNVWLNLNGKNSFNYHLLVQDPIDEIKKQLRGKHYEVGTTQRLQMPGQYDLVDPRGNNLNEVIINLRKNDEMEFARNGHANACGDYVCMYNILNCENHFGHAENRLPQKNVRYVTSDGRFTIYSGCVVRKKSAGFELLNGINLPREFYKFDISNEDEPIKTATIFWEYQKAIGNDGRATISFTTGDLTGNFKFIVQGLTSNGVIYGEKYIRITRP